MQKQPQKGNGKTIPNLWQELAEAVQGKKAYFGPQYEGIQVHHGEKDTVAEDSVVAEVCGSCSLHGRERGGNQHWTTPL